MKIKSRAIAENIMKLKNKRDLYDLASAENTPIDFPDIYEKLLNDPNPKIRGYAADSINGPKHPQYIKLFDDLEIFIRKGIANNPGAIHMKQFKTLFDDYDQEVLYMLARSPKVMHAYPELHKNLWNIDKFDCIAGMLENPESPLVYPEQYSKNFKEKYFRYIVDNENAWKTFPEEFKRCFDSKDKLVLKRLASNTIIPDLFPKEFANLFDCGIPNVYLALIRNFKTRQFKEFKNLYKCKDKSVQYYLKERAGIYSVDLSKG